MRASLAITGIFAAFMSAGQATAQDNDIVINNTTNAGDKCVRDKVNELAEPFTSKGQKFEIGGDKFAKIKTDCIASHGPLNFEKGQAGVTVMPLLTTSSNADRCVSDVLSEIVNDLAGIQGLKSVTVAGLAALKKQCEDKTGAAVVKYKAKTSLTETVRGTTFVFK